MNFNCKKSLMLWATLLFVMLASQVNAAPVEKLVAVKGGSIVEGFQLIAQTEVDGFAPATPIALSIILKNTTKKVLTPTVSYPEADYQLEVTNVKGEILPLTCYGQRRKKGGNAFFGIGPMEIGPNGEMRDTLIVNRFFDMTESEEYLIKVRRSVPKSDKTGFAPIESNIVRLKVDNSIKQSQVVPEKPR